MKRHILEIVLAILFIPLLLFSQVTKTTRYGLNLYSPHDLISAGSKTDTSLANGGTNSNALRTEKYLGIVEDKVDTVKFKKGIAYFINDTARVTVTIPSGVAPCAVPLGYTTGAIYIPYSLITSSGFVITSTGSEPDSTVVQWWLTGK